MVVEAPMARAHRVRVTTSISELRADEGGERVLPLHKLTRATQ